MDLKSVTQAELTDVGTALRGAAAGAGSMEEAASRMVRYLYDTVVDRQTGQKSCALVRFYKTHPYGGLGPDLQEFVRGILGGAAAAPATTCLTLLGTVGDNQQWNSRAGSSGHKAIPLASEEGVAQIPMISRMLSQFGIQVSAVIRPDPNLTIDLGTFYVPQAQGSPYIPAQQEFVVRHGIQSVLGIGGMLSSGELFVIIMFSKVSIPQQTAGGFKAIAPFVREAVQPFVGRKVFA